MQPSEIAEVERLVNSWVAAASPTSIAEMELDAARAAGATAMFGEKYDDVVRVVEVPGVSMELCGGEGREGGGGRGGWRAWHHLVSYHACALQRQAVCSATTSMTLASLATPPMTRQCHNRWYHHAVKGCLNPTRSVSLSPSPGPLLQPLTPPPFLSAPPCCARPLL
jgi:hypothetical protein